MRAIILSQPKSGTYLCQNLLAEFGIHATHRHLNDGYYHQYDAHNLAHSRQHPEQYKHLLPLKQQIDSIPENSVAVTHLEPNPARVEWLQDFKKIVLTRSPEGRAASWERWLQIRPGTANSMDTARWIKFPDAHHITFEQLVDKDITSIDSLQRYLFGRIVVDSAVAIHQALSKPSLTRSNIR